MKFSLNFKFILYNYIQNRVAYRLHNCEHNNITLYNNE